MDSPATTNGSYGTIPKAVLYYSPQSPASASVRLTLREKGYGKDELDLRIVDLSKGENFSLSYLRLNPKATVPTLVVPLQSTLSQSVESKYKAITDPVAILSFLDLSRSSYSQTHTTSQLPAPALSPATPDFSVAQKRIMGEMLLSLEPSDSNSASSSSDTSLGTSVEQDTTRWYNAVPGDSQSLTEVASSMSPTLEGRRSALSSLLQSVEGQPTISGSERPRASAKVKALWKSHLESTEYLLEVFKHAKIPDADLTVENMKAKRVAYYKNGRKTWGAIAERLQRVNQDIVGPLTFGDQLSLADLVVHAYLAQLALLSGLDPHSISTTTGPNIIQTIEAHINAFLGPALKSRFQLPRNYNATSTIESEYGDDNVTPKEKSGAAVPDSKGKNGSTGPLKQVKLAALWDALRGRNNWEGNTKIVLGQT